MIEVNLIPDVKQELLKARRIRNMVVTGSALVGLAATAVVVLLSLYVFLGQLLQHAYFDNQINNKQKEVAAIQGASDLLTIQNQLSVLPQVHDSKLISSRMFSILSAVNPSEPNNVKVSKVALSAQDSTILIEGQAENGYKALETFQKTIKATNIEFMEEGSTESVVKPLTDAITTGETSFGEDASGKRVLRFTITFTFDQELFARSSNELTIVGPSRKNVTDSFVGMPEGLFADRADDIKGEGQ